MGWSLAIDFGTTFTTTATCAGGRVELVEVEGSPYFPSLVCIGDDGRLVVGRAAVEEATRAPALCERLPKRSLATAEYVRLGGRTIETVELVAAVLRRVTIEAAARHGGAPERVVLTHPAYWSGDGVELARFARAASRAGLGEPRLVPEPVAAAQHYVAGSGAALPPGALLAVYDLGGCTFDSAVLRQGEHGLELAGPSAGNTRLGGEDLDAVLAEVVGDHAGSLDAERWTRLWDGSAGEGHRDGVLLWQEIVAAKEALSHRTAVDVPVPGFDAEVHITRREYEAAIDPVLERTVAEFVDAIARAGTAPTSLSAVYLTGGASRTPHVTTLLSDVLDTLPAIDDDPKSAVVRGAIGVGERLGTPGPHRPTPEANAVSEPADPSATGPSDADAGRIRRPLPSDGVLVVVTGAPQAGKTSVVNALLGAEVVPYGRLPCSDPTVVVRWGDHAEGLLFRSTADRPDRLALDQFANWVPSSAAEASAAFADVVYPSDLLEAVTLVDCTTGDDLGPSAAQHARVHVVDVTAPDTPSGAVPDLLVLTKLDLVEADERDERRTAVLERWQQGRDVPHVTVNAPRTLRALLRRNAGSYVSSGGAALLHAVRRLAT